MSALLKKEYFIFETVGTPEVLNQLSTILTSTAIPLVGVVRLQRVTAEKLVEFASKAAEEPAPTTFRAIQEPPRPAASRQPPKGPSISMFFDGVPSDEDDDEADGDDNLDGDSDDTLSIISSLSGGTEEPTQIVAEQLPTTPEAPEAPETPNSRDEQNSTVSMKHNEAEGVDGGNRKEHEGETEEQEQIAAEEPPMAPEAPEAPNSHDEQNSTIPMGPNDRERVDGGELDVVAPDGATTPKAPEHSHEVVVELEVIYVKKHRGNGSSVAPKTSVSTSSIQPKIEQVEDPNAVGSEVETTPEVPEVSHEGVVTTEDDDVIVIRHILPKRGNDSTASVDQKRRRGV